MSGFFIYKYVFLDFHVGCRIIKKEGVNEVQSRVVYQVEKCITLFMKRGITLGIHLQNLRNRYICLPCSTLDKQQV